MTAHLLKTIPFTLLLLLATVCGLQSADAPAIPAEPSLHLLKQCNLRFAASTESSPLPVGKAREATAKSQNPIAVVVTCSDSRTAPEILFGKNIGRLFVVRTAGNVVDDVALGSVEYAIQNLGVRLVIVLGHSGCGAVKAAVSGEHFPPHIASIIQRIRPSVNQAKKEQGDLLSNAIRDNASRVALEIRHDRAIPKGINGLKVVPAVYDLSTGRITWLE
jgi:carbonic anhydrase